MQGRSRMAALMGSAATVAIGVGVFASASLAAGPPPIKQKVKLNLRLDGTSPNSGVEVVIKPGHPACRFKPIVYQVNRDGDIRDIPPIDVETLSPNRDCSFAIILKEPGQPDKIFRRSIQISAPSEATAGKPQFLLCYLSSRGAIDKAALAPNPVASTPPVDSTRKR